MSTLARLRGETENLKRGRNVFVSSEPVSAYKVANNKKQLLEGAHPLVVSLPRDEAVTIGSGYTGVSLLEASAGPQLKWTLSSINHVLRTVSKWGEPTYLFANVLDTDPQAFVAVTLTKRTHLDELDHLEAVISRVCQFHVADSKPLQVPAPDQVVASLGKGLMKLVFGGGSSSSSKHKDTHSTSQNPTMQAKALHPRGAQVTDNPTSNKTLEHERAEYLANLEHRGGVHERGLGRSADDSATRTGGSRRQEPEDVPTAPVLPVQRSAMGVNNKEDAERRVAVLKAELRGEAPPPGGSYSSPSLRPSGPSTHMYPDIPTDDSDWKPQQCSSDWQAHAPGTLSNPFTNNSRDADLSPGPQAPHTTDDTPHTMSYEEYLRRDEDWGMRKRPGARATADVSGSGYSRPTGADYVDAGWGDGGDVGSARDVRHRARGFDGQGGVTGAEREHDGRLYEGEAKDAREEWERTQREAVRHQDWTEPDSPAKPRVRYHEVEGRYADQGPAFAHQGGGGGVTAPQQQRQQKQQAPDWLEMLGKVFAGGGAYTTAAPDL